MAGQTGKGIGGGQQLEAAPLQAGLRSKLGNTRNWALFRVHRSRRANTLAQLTELGARNGTDMTVSVTGTADSASMRPMIRGDLASSGYLSQLETRLFPQLLIRAKLPSEFGAYCWNSSAQAITLRRDTLEQPADQPGMWKLTTKQTEDADPEVAYYNAKGELMRIELRRRGSNPNEVVDPMIWEPITLEQLAQLWRSKGLPMD